MSIDSAIRSIAYSEADTLGAAIAQIAKRNNDVAAAMRADALNQMPVASEGAALERAVQAIAPVVITSAVDSTHLVDKTV